MDPFAAIGLAGNIVAFVDFGYKLVAAAKSIHTSASGSSEHNEDLASMTRHFRSVVADLQGANSAGSMSDGEVALHQIATECDSVSKDILKFLDEVKTKKSNSKRESLRTAFRDWRKKDRKDELELKLDRCRQQLNLQIASLSRSEMLERLQKLIRHGQASESELQSLTKNMDSLRRGSHISTLSQEALKQIRSLIQQSDEAVLAVRHARVLDGLRFESMNERFEDIGEAHQKTFTWIFDGNDDAQESVSRTSLISEDTDVDQCSPAIMNLTLVEMPIKTMAPIEVTPQPNITKPKSRLPMFRMAGLYILGRAHFRRTST
ncbi:Uu.00g099760.m01.CDS01 [Anthostomella pinea]|uniref:Uu.00g099760.m01.CDS01 n=1 Tax=Anthostomella pinea TaxID=933095 RepID=A0AAI8VDE0_9PEZI|nr:Uu.00g099760.m01.CDS01 [Anthostomella pinea]